MLKVSPIRPGGEGYYFSTLRATTDLPDGLIEPDPYWIGQGALELGLRGSPILEEVRRLLHGIDPTSGETLSPQWQSRRTIAAFDVVLSTPKSVSLLHALASPEASDRIGAAKEAAVVATLRFLEDEVLRTGRRAVVPAGLRGERPGGRRELLGTRGAVGVAFPHRTSRANDPHLHTHLVIANVACGVDDRWRSLDSRRIYRSQRVAKVLFEAHLRKELTAIGMRFGPMRRDFADVVGIDVGTIRRFSRQSELIGLHMAAAGLEGPEEAAAIARQIRPEKDRSRPYQQLQEEWRELAHRCGLSQSRLDRAAGLEPALHLLAAGGASTAPEADAAHIERRDAPAAPAVQRTAPVPEVQHPGAEGDLEWLGAAAGRGDGTFTRHDLLIARCASLSEGISIGAAVIAVDRALARPDVLQADGDRYTTVAQQELLQESASRLGSLARETAASVLTYDAAGPLGRAGALAAVVRLAGRPPGIEGGITGDPSGANGPGGAAAPGERRVVALAVGPAAAARFEASTGVESFPVREARSVVPHLGRGDVVVLADCASMLEAEVADVMTACRLRGAQPVLLAAEHALEAARMLEVVQAEAPRIASIDGWRPEPERLAATTAGTAPSLEPAAPRSLGPNLSVELAPDLEAACAAAMRHAIEQQEQGRDALLVLPDHSLVAHVEAALAAKQPVVGVPAGVPTPDPRAHAREPGSLMVLPASKVSARLASSHRDRGRFDHRPPAVVVIGGTAPLSMSATRLAELERTHVVVAVGATRDPMGALARAAEVVRAPHLVAELGPVQREPEARRLWRLGAGLLESYRESCGITAEASAFGRDADVGARSLRRRMSEIRAEIEIARSGIAHDPQRPRGREPARSAREIGGRGLSM